MAYASTRKLFFSTRIEKVEVSQGFREDLPILPTDTSLLDQTDAYSPPPAFDEDAPGNGTVKLLYIGDDSGDHSTWFSHKPDHGSAPLADDSAASDNRPSLVWSSEPRLLDIPAFENGSVQAAGALHKALVTVTVEVGGTSGTPQNPTDTDTDIGYARGGTGGGGGGGKGRTKTVTDPVPDTNTDTTTTPPTTTTTTTNATYDYLSGQDTPNGFNIGLVFSGTGWTDALKLGFTQAAEYLSDIILGDLASVTTSTGIVDDIRIKVTLAPLDGTGGFAGWGEFTAARAGSYLPSEGAVTMDSADSANWLSKGLWDDFALHEMLHCLGFGTAWSAMGLVQSYNGDLRFIGDNATAMYNALYPLLSGPDPLSDFGVPVETDGGSGTAGVHWDDATFKNEIMTGTLSYTNVVSDMTIAALEDMGYDTIHVRDMLLG